MKILGVYGGQDINGQTANLLKIVLEATSAETELVDLNDYALRPDKRGEKNPELDSLEEKFASADVWVLASPTYFGTIAGQMKQALDYLRPRFVRMNSVGDTLPGKYKDKHYVAISSCFAKPLENTFTHQTDATFRTIDKAMSSAGVHKIAELVLPGTWGQHELPERKRQEAETLGRKLKTKTQKDDETMKRYALLFLMIAVIALATMGLQLLIPALTANFWLRYASFVVIFFVLLACLLHYATYMRHKRR